MKKLGIFLVTLFALCLFVIPASAATTDDVVVSFTVADIYDILITDGTWAPTVGYTEIDAGEVESGASEQSLLYKANHVFDITVSYTDTGAATWPGAWTLAAKDDVNTTYHTIPLTTPDDYATAVAAGEATWLMQWKLSGLTFANTPSGNYEATVTFTIEAG